MSEGGRRAGFFAKLVGTIAWGLVLALSARAYLGESFLGIQVSIATYLAAGLCWPVVWGVFWLARLLIPMPFELVPRLFELILVGPGHFAAWVLFGKKSKRDESGQDPKPAMPEAVAPAPAPLPAPTPLPDGAPPPEV